MANWNETIKKKQFLLIGVIMTAIIGGSMLVVATSKKSNDDDVQKPIIDDDIVLERYSGIGSNVDPDEIWRATSSNEIDSLKKQNETLKNELSTFKRSIEQEVKKAVQDKTVKLQEEMEQKQNSQIQQLKNQMDKDKEQAKKTVVANPIVGKSTPSNQISVTRKVFERQNPGLDNPGLATFNSDDLTKKPEPALQSLTLGVDIIDTDTELKNIALEAERQAMAEQESTEVVQNNYVPAGSFVRGIILGGIDAPTGGQAEENPVPVLVEISDIANLPNSKKYDFVSCRAIGAGYGDVSSERAMIRMEKLSCIDDKNRVYETFIKGGVYDETGKFGAKGRLVSKTGTILANSLLAGIGSGIGKAFSQSSTTYSNNALGTSSMSFPSTNDAVVAGLGSGVGTAFDRLSKYYIKLAEQMFPVIEVDAGRMIDIVFTSGFELKPGKQNTASSSSTTQGSNAPSGNDITIGQLTQGAGQTITQVQNMITPR
ncbi:TraB/VirB10 family protein [Thiomicrorhabdus hydrogeniphila]